MIPDGQDIAEYIRTRYRNKVVEIGVGSRPQVALALKGDVDVLVTDIHEQAYAGVRFCRDDILNPDMKIYQNTSLIYSIRPPIELQEAMARIAREVGADLLIRPFGNERADLSRYFRKYDLLNYKRARFYLYKSEREQDGS